MQHELKNIKNTFGAFVFQLLCDRCKCIIDFFIIFLYFYKILQLTALAYKPNSA